MTSNIVRTKTEAKGGITPEEKVKLEAHAKLWIDRAFRTAPIEPDKIVPAIEGLYATAGLKKPRVVVVSSPLVMAFAYGAASAILKEAKNKNATRGAIYDATYDATYAATDDAIRGANDAATDDATDDAIRGATYGATYDATDDAIRGATYGATYAATDAATDDANYDATYDATYAATDAATDGATYAATYAATRGATDAAIRGATYGATRGATYDATYDATDDATYAATYAATDDATRGATYDATDAAIRGKKFENGAARACLELAGKEGLKMAARWNEIYQGGNAWAAYDCYLTAFRDVIGLELPEYNNYKYWEQAAIHGGFRVMHSDFCLVSDFPEFIKVDEQNRPHCETGPSHRWRDGWSLYHWHGTTVPGHWIENRKTVPVIEILKVTNTEQRIAGLQIVGWDRALPELKAKVIDDSGSDDIGQLIEIRVPGLGEGGLFLRAKCPRNGWIMEGVPRTSDIDGLPITTALAAQAWRIGDPQSEYQHPTKRT